jgi:hypothetical protein
MTALGQYRFFGDARPAQARFANCGHHISSVIARYPPFATGGFSSTPPSQFI